MYYLARPQPAQTPACADPGLCRPPRVLFLLIPKRCATTFLADSRHSCPECFFSRPMVKKPMMKSQTHTHNKNGSCFAILNYGPLGILNYGVKAILA